MTGPSICIRWHTHCDGGILTKIHEVKAFDNLDLGIAPRLQFVLFHYELTDHTVTFVAEYGL